MTDRIFGLAIAALALLVWYLFHRADTEVEASVNRALGPVVPLDDLMDGPANLIQNPAFRGGTENWGGHHPPAGIPDCPECGGSGVIQEDHDGGTHPVHCPCTMLHEQDSAEAYDDLPDMDVEAGIILHGRIEWIDSEGIKRVFGPSPVDEVRARKEWADEWNARLKLDFDGGAR